MSGLSNLEREVLAFEAAGVWRYAGRKAQVVIERFDMTMTRYTQVLVTTIAKPAAEQWDPTTVRRIRARLAAKRSPRRTGWRQ